MHAPEGALPLQARGLVKRYGDLVAVAGVDLSVRVVRGLWVLGPNGAGKTTTLRIALGLIAPSEGVVELFGRDPMRLGARALDGVAGFVEEPRFYPYLSGATNLRLLAALDGDGAQTRIDQALGTVELADRAQDRVGGYSHGMRQRLGIAAALIRAPQLLILDEPATGLDPAGMRDMRLLIRRLAGEGITVLLSSHQLSEVQEICDRLAIIRSGRIVYEGALVDLRLRAGRGYGLHTSDNRRALEVASAAPGIHEAALADGEVRFNAEEADVGALSLALAEAGVQIYALRPELATLEELFFRLTEGASEADGKEPGPADEAPPSRELSGV